MTWGEVSVGLCLEWTVHKPSEAYLVLAVEDGRAHDDGCVLAFKLLDLTDGDVFVWPCPHEPGSDIEEGSCRLLGA